MNGVLVIDKPRGPTSFDMVARVRRAAGERRVGHAGTLDPMATGVLVMCLGEATKLVPYLMDADKEYRATVRLGIATETDDAEGSQVLFRSPPAALLALTESRIRSALAAMVGQHPQRPPRYSALKIDGERLHARARENRDDEQAVAEQLLAKQRDVTIHEIRVEHVALADPASDALPEVTISVRCGKGTYIRSIARDLGEQLGTGGHLIALRRLRVGRFTPEQAAELVADPGPPETRSRGDRFAVPPRLFTPAEAVAHLPTVKLPAALAARVRNGQKAALAEVADMLPAHAIDPAAMKVAAIDENGALAAVLRVEGDHLVIARGFAA